MTKDSSTLLRNFGPANLKPLLDAQGIHGTSAVQAGDTVEETDYLPPLEMAHPSILGLVGQAERKPGLNGLLMLILYLPDPDFAFGRAHLRGVGLLAHYGLTDDLLLNPPQIVPALV